MIPDKDLLGRPAHLLPLDNVSLRDQLYAEAEALARELHSVIGDVMPDDDMGEVWCFWEDESAAYRKTRIEAHLLLLRDLSRPASMDAACKRLAVCVGLGCTTAPGWYSVPPHGGESEVAPRLWLLVGAGYQSAQVHDLPDWDKPVPLLRVRVPGISKILDPAEAMVAALLFLFATEPS